MSVEVTLPDKDDNNKYPLFAFPGGYLIAYFTNDGELMCGDCANQIWDFDFDKPVGFFIDEGCYEAKTQCCHCNKLLDPALRSKRDVRRTK